MSHSPTNYLATLRDHLKNDTSLSHREITEAIGEHRDLITELAATGVDLGAELGDPATYAAAVTGLYGAEEATDRKKPLGRFMGVPFDFSGPTDTGARRRIWDPQDSRIFQPRLFGLGWTVNIGAVAVRLGLIRPDDIDADVVEAIPAPVFHTARAVPAILATAGAATLAASWRELPRTVALNFTLTGEPRGRRYPRAALAALPTVGAGLATLPYLPSSRRNREDALRAASIGALVTSAVLGTVAATVAEARGSRRPGLWAVAALGLGAVSSVGVLIGPFWTGLGRVWRREGVR